jgi:hypothetical protein
VSITISFSLDETTVPLTVAVAVAVDIGACSLWANASPPRATDRTAIPNKRRLRMLPPLRSVG